MAGITLEIATARLGIYLDAEAKILDKQRVTIDGTELTFADLEKVQAGVDVWNKRVQSLSSAAAGGRARIRYGVPV